MNWISVKDRLPKQTTDVLCFGVREADNGWCIFTAGLFYDKWMSAETEDYCKYEVTHWMELPKIP